MKEKIIRFLQKIFNKEAVTLVDPKEILFEKEFQEFREKSILQSREFHIEWEDRFPCLDDKTEKTGFDRHYVYHTAWAVRKVLNSNVREHYDISSCLYFCSILSASITVNFYDYRPADIKLSNLNSRAADLQKLPFKDNSIKSLSCMHVIEHIGLGRYGDPLDPCGDIKAIKELVRVLAPGGKLLIVVPIGHAKICFNAHRIYSYSQVIELFKDLKINEFTLIPEDPNDGGLLIDPESNILEKQNYACGCFEFIKQ